MGLYPSLIALYRHYDTTTDAPHLGKYRHNDSCPSDFEEYRGNISFDPTISLPADGLCPARDDPAILKTTAVLYHKKAASVRADAAGMMRCMNLTMMLH
jgi:hypothetical protein